MAACDGAVVLRAADGKVQYQDPIPRACAEEIAGLGDDAFKVDATGGRMPPHLVKINAVGRSGDLEMVIDELGLGRKTLRLVASSSERWLQVVADGVNKAAGLAALLEITGIEAGRVVAFGNGVNDLPMFSLAGTSVAVADAPQRIREGADFIAPSCAEEGVARFLEILPGC